MTETRHTIGLQERLPASRDKQFSFRWPLAIDQRLDALAERATSVGEKVSRKELVAALILACDLDGNALSSVLRTYRTTTVQEAVLDTETSGTVIQLDAHRPGPRSLRE